MFWEACTKGTCFATYVWLHLVSGGRLLCPFNSVTGLSRSLTSLTEFCCVIVSCSCSCDPDERLCVPEPRETGTPCGEDLLDYEDYYFGQCNQGPGFCEEVESELGDFGICLGIPLTGKPCDDFNQCTKNDKCKVVSTDDGLCWGMCVGTFDADLPCSDRDEQCTINDR
jgi:hypothetical protein